MNIAREARAKQTSEVFTPNKITCNILSKLPESVWEEGKTFCDPAVGNGNLVVWVLIYKIRNGHDSLSAIQSIYGCDIMQDNIKECRLRLLRTIEVFDPVITKAHIAAVLTNIVWINTDKFPSGSLEYDFSFNNQPSEDDVAQWMNYMSKRDENELPTNEVQLSDLDIFAID